MSSRGGNCDPGDVYYVIGSCEESDALHHEMAHGLYATCQAYRQQVQVALAMVSVHDRAVMRTKLLEMGYCEDEEILEDEMQAYMAGGADIGGDACIHIREKVESIFKLFAGVERGCPYASVF